MNARRNLVVAFHMTRGVREYSPGGQQLKEMRLQSDVAYPQHAIQLDENRYAVVHESNDGTGLRRLCIVSSDGAMLETFGSKRGSGTNQMGYPRRMVLFGGNSGRI